MAEEKEAPKKEAKTVPQATLVEVPTEYGLAFQLEDGSVVTRDGLMAAIYNKVLKLEKVLV